MNSQATGSGLVGYNVQAAVDTKHHLIVAHEVTNVGNDRAQLSKMAKAAREAMGKSKLHALADRGYFNGTELKACEDVGITAFVPTPMTSGAKAAGRFDKSDFIYIAKDDEYQCPAGERAIYRFSTLERNGLNAHVYWSSACLKCTVEHVFGTLKHWMGSTHFMTKTLAYGHRRRRRRRRQGSQCPAGC